MSAAGAMGPPRTMPKSPATLQGIPQGQSFDMRNQRSHRDMNKPGKPQAPMSVIGQQPINVNVNINTTNINLQQQANDALQKK